MIFWFLFMASIILGGIGFYIFFIAPKLDPNNRAEEFLKENKIEDAIIEYRKILDENPYDFLTNYRIANLYIKQNEIDEAALHLEKILEINKFNFEVDKLTVEKKLAKIYMKRDEIDKCFQMYHDILSQHPTDDTALYNTAFIALGQEEYDLAQRYFERLVKIRKKDFEVAFGAGMCSYQNQKTNDAVEYFKIAVSLRPNNDIALMAMVFAYLRKRDYRKSLGYIEMLIKNVTDPQVKFIVLRIEAFLYVMLKKSHEAVSKFEELLGFTKANEFIDEIALTLYDLGFASLNDEQSKKAYKYWNDLDTDKKDYRGINAMIIQLRKEMDDSENKSGFESPLYNRLDSWVKNSFPSEFLWGICGLKSSYKIDLKKYITYSTGLDGSFMSQDNASVTGTGAYLIDTFNKLDTDSFRIISNRAIEKMGYKIDHILTTYKESDGVDFMGKHRQTGDLTLFEVRRWTQTKVGEIPLRNFAQAVNDAKAKKGLFITTAQLTEGAAASLKHLNKIEVVLADDFNRYLQGLM
ncbi:MAG: restriction endonuclease [Spirochaetes bacterium]|nr:restriction endonuclease [Spirochaetota bacterium]